MRDAVVLLLGMELQDRGLASTPVANALCRRLWFAGTRITTGIPASSGACATFGITTIQRDAGGRMLNCHLLEGEDSGMTGTLRAIRF
jgi:hypothetical protein